VVKEVIGRGAFGQVGTMEWNLSCRADSSSLLVAVTSEEEGIGRGAFGHVS
jgi:hypothetical protein